MTPGNHSYCVGFQDGTFPDMGWHIKGEMGGLWAHPIKLLDGFHAAVVWGTDTTALDTAQSYTTTPVGSIFTYNIDGKSITRTQFIPDPAKGMVIVEGELQTHLDITFLREDVIGENQLLLTQQGRKNWTLRTKIPEGAEVMVGDQIIQPTLDEEGYAEMTDREVVIRW